MTDEERMVERMVEILAANEMGDPVAYRKLRAADWPVCLEDCLAPGSSPHSHPPIIGYLLIGTRGYVEVTANLEPTAVGTLHPLAKYLCNEARAVKERS